MSQNNDNDEIDPDEALFAELNDALRRLDPLPPRLAAAARAAFSWRTIDAELAALTHDTLLDDDRVAAIRSGDTPRLLTFDGEGLSAEVEATDVGRRRQLAGQLVPPQPGEVEIADPGGERLVDVDEVGCFFVDDLPPGPVRLRCRTRAGRIFQTPWVVI